MQEENKPRYSQIRTKQCD